MSLPALDDLLHWVLKDYEVYGLQEAFPEHLLRVSFAELEIALGAPDDVERTLVALLLLTEGRRAGRWNYAELILVLGRVKKLSGDGRRWRDFPNHCSPEFSISAMAEHCYREINHDLSAFRRVYAEIAGLLNLL